MGRPPGPRGVDGGLHGGGGGNGPDSKERIEAAKKAFAEVLAEVEQASKEG